MSADRRTFLQLLTTGALSGAFPSSIARALEIPANHRTGSIADVEHIIILMQENRSFDHYFGMLRGVRGFGDPRPVNLSSGQSVWHQPNGNGYVLPFHPAAPNLGLEFLEDLPHDWTTTQAAWNGGRYDAWVPNKRATTMAHLTRSDIPYHYALADAFTVCDAYHCSVFGPTDPNRYYMWSGWVGNDGQGGGPVVDNAEEGYGWSTYPERLQDAGISWKIYQDQGIGLTAAGGWGNAKDPYVGNYGDNSLLYFRQYQSAAPGTPLAQRAKTGTNISANGSVFDIFRVDILKNSLPQVSWIIAPEAYSEHPNWPANYGAWYVSQILDLLTAKPEIWSKTALFITYDENDGFFDHMVPPTAPMSRAQGLSTVDTTNEIFPGSKKYASGPYGLGVRVPLLVISPWSKGGWVSSEVFDHTSLIQFMEKRFGAESPGLREHNITPWRRAVTGDLTSTFDFKAPNSTKVSLPSTVAYVPPDNKKHPDYKPTPPAQQAMPVQEPGTRPARGVPYALHVRGGVDASKSAVTISFRNTGQSAAVFQVRSGNSLEGPWTYTVGSDAEASDTWTFSDAKTAYDLSVYGPNGFFRSFKGDTRNAETGDLDIQPNYHANNPGITLIICNSGSNTVKLRISDAYSKQISTLAAKAGDTLNHRWDLGASYGWYDLTLTLQSAPEFQQRIAGHVETGEDSVSDPAIGS